jgi:hypothetical protein
LFTVSQEGCERLAIDATANPFTGRPARSERYRLDGIERSQARSDTYVRAFFKGEQLVVEQRTGVEVKRDSYSLTSQPCGRAAGSTLFLEKKTEKDGAAPACFRWAKL